MSANLKDPFGPSCCDGGSCPTTKQSAQPCGCDPGINYISPWCEKHRESTQPIQIKDTIYELTEDTPKDSR